MKHVHVCSCAEFRGAFDANLIPKFIIVIAVGYSKEYCNISEKPFTKKEDGDIFIGIIFVFFEIAGTQNIPWTVFSQKHEYAAKKIDVIFDSDSIPV